MKNTRINWAAAKEYGAQKSVQYFRWYLGIVFFIIATSYGALAIVSFLLKGIVSEKTENFVALIVLLFALFGQFAGLSKTILSIHDTGKPSIKAYISALYLGLYAGITGVFLFCLIPIHIIMIFATGKQPMLRFSLAEYLIVDQKIGPIAALKKSYQMTTQEDATQLSTTHYTSRQFALAHAYRQVVPQGK